MHNNFFRKTRDNYFANVASPSITILFSGPLIQRSADQEYPFEVNRNFYYLSGINQANVVLVLIKNKTESVTHLFIEKNDPLLTKWVGKKLELLEASEISGIDYQNIHYVNKFDDFLFSLLNNTRGNTTTYQDVYLDLERRQLPSYSNQALEFASKLNKDYPAVNIHNCYDDIIGLRMIKHPEEIEKIIASIDTTKGGIEELMKTAKPGLFEYQLESYYDLWIKFHGNKRIAFDTIAASGKNATILHYNNNNDVLQADDLILFDLGCQTDLYVSDISRTFPISGKFTKRQKEVYETVLNVNKKCIEFLKPGVTWQQFNNYARSLLIDGCKKLGLIEKDDEITKFYFHSIGHSIGLDTHDPTLHSIPLEAGMVVTVEPGLYIEEENIGIRIEDNILITETGHINLSEDIIKEVTDIENFMNK